DTLRAHLDTPAAERPSDQSEERQTPRPARRKRRQNKDRWREGEPERRGGGDFFVGLLGGVDCVCWPIPPSFRRPGPPPPPFGPPPLRGYGPPLPPPPRRPH